MLTLLIWLTGRALHTLSRAYLDPPIRMVGCQNWKEGPNPLYRLSSSLDELLLVLTVARQLLTDFMNGMI